MSNMKYVKGGLAIATAVATPFGAWAMNESSIKAAIMMAVIGGLTSAYNWVDQAFAKEMSDKPTDEQADSN